MKSVMTLCALVLWAVFIYAFVQWKQSLTMNACETIYKTTNDATKNLYSDVMNPDKYNIPTDTWGGYSVS